MRSLLHPVRGCFGRSCVPGMRDLQRHLQRQPLIAHLQKFND